MATPRNGLSLQLVDDPVARAPGNTPAPGPAPADVELLDAYSKAVVHVVEKVGPAVVGVTVRGGRGRGGGGSGVLFTPDGYMLTNAHVVAGPREMRAALTDRPEPTPDPAGRDPPPAPPDTPTQGAHL